MSGEMSGNVSDDILALVKKIPKITIPQMAKALGITPRTVECHIAVLKQSGQLERIGFSKNYNMPI